MQFTITVEIDDVVTRVTPDHERDGQPYEHCKVYATAECVIPGPDFSKTKIRRLVTGQGWTDTVSKDVLVREVVGKGFKAAVESIPDQFMKWKK